MSERELKAQQIVNNHALLAGGTGFLPLPVLDILGVMTVQGMMLYKLASLYGYKLREDWGKATVYTIFGGSLPTWLGYGTVGYLVSKLPIMGGLLGYLAVPSLASAATLALGKIFIVHFESGGHALDFDVQKMREAFAQQFEAEKKPAA